MKEKHTGYIKERNILDSCFENLNFEKYILNFVAAFIKNT